MSKKYKFTKEIVEIAVEDGMTQELIAIKCGVSQNTVSLWKNGHKQARVSKIIPLINKYARLIKKELKN